MTEKVAVVTGANQGLGLALVEELCNRLGPRAVVYLTARDAARGEASRALLLERGIESRFLGLDVSEDASVLECAGIIRERHAGIDVVISNAAQRITREHSDAEQVKAFVNTNNRGTLRMIRAFGPLLRDGARFVVVASSFGSLRHLDPKLHPEFDVEHASQDDVQGALDRWVALVQSGTAESAGWPTWINVPSKIGQVVAMKIFAREMSADRVARDISINASCPGLVDTEASRPWFDDMSSAQTPSAAAVDVVWLATIPEGMASPYGELVRHREIVDWQARV